MASVDNDDDDDFGADGTTPPRLRLRLKTIEDVRREMARIYKEGKAHRRDVQECSRLANILSMMARLIEGGELEKRLAALEQQLEADATPRSGTRAGTWAGH